MSKFSLLPVEVEAGTKFPIKQVVVVVPAN
jgi:hypothetical protein